ncbi:MAG: hypothetical protein JO092_01045, partial [Candidatus Eremiobacteraeota bacterium]|nr:hypothetical protein [Candidatus Eremiobacteraeota bacterium]
MRLQLVVDRRFVTMLTDAHGIARWNRFPRPIFALAQWGESYAFVSLLPQAPLPSTIVVVRTESAVVHAGETVRVVGFARTREAGVLRPTRGEASVSLRLGATLVGEQRLPIDAAGAFSATFTVPETAVAGDYAVLAQAAGGTGGATLHVDANAGGLSLGVSAQCASSCDPDRDIPLLVHSSRGGASVHVIVVRSPHVYLGYAVDETPWAATTWLDETVRTAEDGNVTISIPHPSDELSSTYGVRVESGGATSGTRIVVPRGEAAVRLQLDRQEQTLGTPVQFSVDASDLTNGKALANQAVTVQLVHGTSISQQQLTLDADGHARGEFSAPPLGTNLVFASVEDRGRSMDAAAVQVVAAAAGPSVDQGSSDVRVSLDRAAYRSGDDVTVHASTPGAQGDALVTLESALGVQAAVAPTNNGEASARFRVGDATGQLRVGAAFVRDGAIEWGGVALGLDAPGRPALAGLSLARADFSPGESTSVSLRGESHGESTLVVRITRGTPSGSALFESALSLLEIGVATTQVSAPSAVTWHPWVDSTGDHAQVLGFVRRTEPPQIAELAEAQTDAVSWSVARANDQSIAVQVPSQSGNYTLSVLDISDDGSVTAASQAITVR